MPYLRAGLSSCWTRKKTTASRHAAHQNTGTSGTSWREKVSPSPHTNNLRQPNPSTVPAAGLYSQPTQPV